MKGSIIDDFRLPRDPKIGGTSLCRNLPELTVGEMEALKIMAQSLIDLAADEPAWMLCAIPYKHKVSSAERAIATARLEPDLKKLAAWS
jgi:hypothetical protein